MTPPVPVLVLGGTGYVAGEVVRLLCQHPGFEIAAVLSESRAGAPVGETFPHLAGALGDLRFSGADAVASLLGAAAGATKGAKEVALVSAAPHGASAVAVAKIVAEAEACGAVLSVVDLSADFRFADAGDYAAVYGHPHGAPELLARFVAAVPEHLPASGPLRATPNAGAFVAHPGCFTTAALLAIVPLLAERIVEPEFAITAITGSTGSGRTLTEKTHHPERRSNVAAYTPLAHRHAPEMAALAAQAVGAERGRPEIAFVPLSGPQARGIYATVQARLAPEWQGASRTAVAEACRRFYAGSPFVSVTEEPPALTEVIGTQRGRLGVATDARRVAVTVAIDNLVKGAAGGGVQWLNRIYGFPETAGLLSPGLGWF